MRTFDADRWERAKALFQGALDNPAEQRADWLAAHAGGDEPLVKDVAALLDSDGDSADFLEQTAASILASGEHQPRARLLNEGDMLGRYEIAAFLGAGAVSEVYRARDRRLGRTVALKFLTDPGAPHASAWLLREAQHASTLNHPHICTVHEVDEVNGLPFIVLEDIDGPTLQTIATASRPPLDAVRRWGVQIADALDHAHHRGIIHRDLKTSNVVVTREGSVKVLDFGLARRMNADSTTAAFSVLTDASVAGTLTHMAPEVFQGDPVDARIDIWAAGVMLYELVSGRLPFTGGTPFSIANAVVDRRPEPLPDTVPPALERVIARCLSKDPVTRYQTAAELRDALTAIGVTPAGRADIAARRRQWWVAASIALVLVAGSVSAFVVGRSNGMAARADPRSRLIAVLPFAGGDRDPERVLADGVTEGLIAELGRVDAVRVMAASTARKFRDRRDPLRDLRRETGATQVLDGEIVRSDERVRLSARLIEAASGRVLWSEEYDRSVRDLQALYGTIAAAVAEAAEVRLTTEDAGRFSAIRAVDPDVYEAYLKGRYHWNRRTTESLHEAISQYQSAVALDPTYAPAYAALADCYNQLATVMVGGGSPKEWRPRAAEAAIKALQIDPQRAEAHATLGYVRHYSGEWKAAEDSLRRAIALNPNYALGRIWYANYLSSRGRADEAIREVRFAEQLDPLSPIIGTNVGWVLINARRYGEAIEQLRRTIALDPSYPQAHSRLGAAYSFSQQHAQAIAEYELTATLSERSPSSLVALAQAYGLAGRTREAEQLLNQLVAGLAQRYVASGAIANVYAAMGRRDEALTWLERSLEERTNNIAYLAVEPVYDSLRDDPRFQSILRRAGLP